MDERQDIHSGRRLEWRWVGVGTLIVLGMQTLLGALLAALGADAASWPFVVLEVTVAFALGGVVVGLLSPGYTAWEAGFASVIAAAGLVFLASRLLGSEGLLRVLPVAVCWGLLCGLAGGWVGERLQGRSSR